MPTFQKKHHRRWVIFLLPFLLPVGCAGPRYTKQPLLKWNEENPIVEKLKIGLLADSQLQTNQSFQRVPLISGKFEDVVVPVAIRPPAVNTFSKNLLRYFLNQLSKKKPDLILYLGDAANNGCEDEIEQVFEILREYRCKNKIPIFFIIGNHDYLGGGNTPYMPDRRLLCDSSEAQLESDMNRPLTKYELMQKVWYFNQESGDIKAEWKYKSNFENKQELFRNCVENKGKKETGAERLHQHRKPGCFLTGMVFSKKHKVEILLIDTSDYGDKAFAYQIPLFMKGFFGLTGWISTGSEDGIDSQLSWFQNQKEFRLEPPAVRIAASHYPVSDLGAAARKIFISEGLPNRFASVFTPEPSIGNYWVSGHTHDVPEQGDLYLTDTSGNGKKRLRVQLLNLGSTTDSNLVDGNVYGPHAVLASIVPLKISDRANPMQIDTITTDTLASDCECIIDRIKKQPTMDSPAYYPVDDRVSGRALFGICPNYRKLKWKRTDTIHAMKNLRLLIEHLKPQVAEKLENNPDLIEICIAKEASRLEAIGKPCEE